MIEDKESMDRYITGNYGEDQYNHSEDWTEGYAEGELYGYLKALKEVKTFMETHSNANYEVHSSWTVWNNLIIQLDKMRKEMDAND